MNAVETGIEIRHVDGTLVFGPYELAPTALGISGQPSFEEWEELGRFLRQIQNASQWWWGDWLAFGEGSFGEKVTQVMEATDWGPDTLSVYASVCRRVPALNRFKDVPFSFYANHLASLAPEEQRRWAERVREEKWTRDQLREELRADQRRVKASLKPASRADATQVKILLNTNTEPIFTQRVDELSRVLGTDGRTDTLWAIVERAHREWLS